MVATLSGILASMIVAAGAVAGAFAAAVVGRGLWPLASEPSTASLAGSGPVELTMPSFTGFFAGLAVASTLAIAAWLTGRVLAFVLGSTAAVALLALLSGPLPSWVPVAQLPATNGTWLHHYGEVSLLWQWPVKPNPLDSNWTALAESNPQTAALIGLLLLLLIAALALPRALRQPSK